MQVCRRKTWTRIIENASLVTVRAGEMLFNRGEPARHFFMVIEGRIELSLVSPLGEKKIIDVISSGNTFAEAIMFNSQSLFPVCACRHGKFPAGENRQQEVPGRPGR